MTFPAIAGFKRYFFMQILTATLFITGLLAATIWLVTSLRFIDYIVNRGLPLTSFLSLVALTLPSLLNVALPLAIFAAVLFVHQRAAQDNEIVVLRGAGVGPLALATPAMTIGLIGTLLTFTLSLYFMPAGQRAFKDWQNAIRNDYAQVALRDGAFNRLGPGMTVFLRERVAAGELRGLLIHNTSDPARPETLLAERGVITAGAHGPRILLVKGSRQVLDRATGRLSFLSFDRYVFEPKFTTRDPTRRTREAGERFIGDLFFPHDIDRLKPSVARGFWAEGHARLASPLTALAFAMVAAAATLSGAHSRHRNIRRPLAAVVVVAAASGTMITLENLVTDGLRVAALGLYLAPVALFAGAGAVLLAPPRRRRRGAGARMAVTAP